MSRGSPLPPAVMMRNVLVLTLVLVLGVEGETPPVYGSNVSLKTNGQWFSNLPTLAVLVVCESSAVSRYLEHNAGCV